MEKRSVNPRGIHRAAANLPPAYLALLAEFPLRPIENDTDYERAAALIHRLAMRQEPLTEPEREYLDVLEMLVDQYDAHHPCPISDDLTPTQALRTLVQQAGMTVTELGRLLGSKSAASELLSGKRKEPSKTQIARLCARFKVDAAAFLLSRAPRVHAA